jgi:uncharacterized protein involved in outer membrane biogenesis
MIRRRRRTDWRKNIGTLVLVLLLVALVLPFVVPLKRWFPELESQLSIALGAPVKYDGLRAGLSPRPYLEAQNVVIGEDRSLHAARARLYPDLLSLSEPTIFIKLTELDDVMVERQAVQRFFAERGVPETTVPRLRLGHVHASHLKLDLLAGKFGEFDAEADVGRDNRLVNFALTSSDNRIKFDAVPASGALLLTFSAQDWKPPAGPGITFDRLYAQGALSEGKLAVSEFTAGLYGGDIRGGFQLTWGNSWVVSGRALLSRLDAYPMLQAMQSPLRVHGMMDGEMHFASEATDATQLADTLKLDGKFKLTNGVIDDFDFAKVIQGVGSDGMRGGKTSFEQFTGNFQTGGGYHFSGMRLQSTKMTVSGNVNATPTGQLSGAVGVELKGTTSTLNSNVQIGGIFTDPVILPGK